MQRVGSRMVRSFDADFQSVLPESEIGNSFFTALNATLSLTMCANNVEGFK